MTLLLILLVLALIWLGIYFSPPMRRTRAEIAAIEADKTPVTPERFSKDRYRRNHG
jgi:hypothetical protein